MPGSFLFNSKIPNGSGKIKQLHAPRKTPMKNLPKLLLASFVLFGIALVSFVCTGIVLDSLLSSIPTFIQRMLLVLFIILPAGIGALLGLITLFQKPRRVLLSLLALILNGLTAVFFLFLALFAG